MSKQDQQSGDNSTNIQANEIVVHQGLSYSDVKQVALDVFRANFYELVGKAHEIAGARAAEITEDFLKKLQSENPSGFSKAEDPAFQRALFTVQQEYASTGDKDLGSLLVDLLVDRSKHEQRDILQIVLNESLSTAPKLTNDQLAVLAVIFLFKYTQNHGIGNHVMLGQYFDRNVLPFADKLNKSDSCYQHLEYSGCGSIGMGEVGLVQVMKIHYQGMFLKGFDAVEVSQKEISVGLDQRFFLPCLNDLTKYQVKATNKDGLNKLLDVHLIGQEDRTKIIALFDQGLMSDEEVINKCVSIRPYMEQVFSTWASSSMKNFTLTSVGIAIGHANIKRLVGEFADLSIWIN
ncbi:MAG: hypothetical protein Q7T21_09865 [Gallionella sp.]|nr:hypothetical protein [Gallionella sp.]